jgi:hypothetical protein
MHTHINSITLYESVFFTGVKKKGKEKNVETYEGLDGAIDERKRKA